MSTGVFKISSEAALKLEFQRSASESGESSYDLSCTWEEKEIIGFVTRVGFLSNKLSCEEMAKEFLCLHEVSLMCKSVLFNWLRSRTGGTKSPSHSI